MSKVPTKKVLSYLKVKLLSGADLDDSDRVHLAQALSTIAELKRELQEFTKEHLDMCRDYEKAITEKNALTITVIAQHAAMKRLKGAKRGK
jgi:Zn-dependent oligopeptidase